MKVIALVPFLASLAVMCHGTPLPGNQLLDGIPNPINLFGPAAAMHAGNLFSGVKNIQHAAKNMIGKVAENLNFTPVTQLLHHLNYEDLRRGLLTLDDILPILFNHIFLEQPEDPRIDLIRQTGELIKLVTEYLNAAPKKSTLEQMMHGFKEFYSNYVQIQQQEAAVKWEQKNRLAERVDEIAKHLSAEQMTLFQQEYDRRLQPGPDPSPAQVHLVDSTYESLQQHLQEQQAHPALLDSPVSADQSYPAQQGYHQQQQHQQQQSGHYPHPAQSPYQATNQHLQVPHHLMDQAFGQPQQTGQYPTNQNLQQPPHSMHQAYDHQQQLPGQFAAQASIQFGQDLQQSQHPMGQHQQAQHQQQRPGHYSHSAQAPFHPAQHPQASQQPMVHQPHQQHPDQYSMSFQSGQNMPPPQGQALIQQQQHQHQQAPQYQMKQHQALNQQQQHYQQPQATYPQGQHQQALQHQMNPQQQPQQQGQGQGHFSNSGQASFNPAQQSQAQPPQQQLAMVKPPTNNFNYAAAATGGTRAQG